MKRKFGCLMVQIDDPNWEQEINDLITKDDIYQDESGDYGMETDPHTTVLYGLHDGEFDYEQLKAELPPVKDIKISTGDIKCFENDDYDVVVYEVISDDLHRLNNQISDNYPFTTDYPDYKPHVTIAYVKKGEGKKYADKSKKIDREVKEYRYGFKNGDNEFFNNTETINEFISNDVIYLKKYLMSSDDDKKSGLSQEYPWTWEYFNASGKWDEYTNYDMAIVMDDLPQEVKDEWDNWLFEEINNGSYQELGISDSEIPSWAYMSYRGIVKNKWLVHQTNEANAILKDGFTMGVDDLTRLGLTTHMGDHEKQYGGYNFAYDIDDVDQYGSTRHGNKYGEEAVFFRASGIKVDHHSDQEPQVIFRGKEAKNIVPAYKDEFMTSGRWTIYGKDGKIMVQKDTLGDIGKWLEKNYDQYRKQLNESLNLLPLFEDFISESPDEIRASTSKVAKWVGKPHHSDNDAIPFCMDDDANLYIGAKGGIHGAMGLKTIKRLAIRYGYSGPKNFYLLLKKKNLFDKYKSCPESRSESKFPGRLWTDSKIISMWGYPKSQDDLMLLVTKLCDEVMLIYDIDIDPMSLNIEIQSDSGSKIIKIADYGKHL